MTKDGRGRPDKYLPASPRTQSGRGTGILFRTPRKRLYEHQTNTTNNSEQRHNYDSMKPCKRVMSAGA